MELKHATTQRTVTEHDYHLELTPEENERLVEVFRTIMSYHAPPGSVDFRPHDATEEVVVTRMSLTVTRRSRTKWGGITYRRDGRTYSTGERLEENRVEFEVGSDEMPAPSP